MASNKKFSIIVAVCKNNGIGVNGTLPWKLKKEMQYFTRITSNACVGKQNAVIMGRNTWHSIPDKFRPLPNRVNAVLSTTLTDVPKGAHYLFASLTDAIEKLSNDRNIDQLFIIGGESVYKESLSMNECDKVYLTRIDQHFDCDTFFPQVDTDLFKPINEIDVPQEVQQEDLISYQFYVYKRE